MQSVVGPERQLVVLLIGGPYDGQDIVVSKEEWKQGSLIRNGYRYASKSEMPDAGAGSAGMRTFTWMDPAR